MDAFSNKKQPFFLGILYQWLFLTFDKAENTMSKAKKLLCANKSMKLTRGIRYLALLISDSNGIKGNYTNVVSADLELSLDSQVNLSS